MDSEIKIIDTHTHPQLRQYDQDRDAVIQRALDAGVGMICVGVDFESSKDAIELAKKYEKIWASVGLHPNDNLKEKYDQSSYTEIAQDEKVIAIGEIGLDYYRTTEQSDRIFQRQRFEQQLALAEETEKPVIIHCRDTQEKMPSVSAHQDMQRMLREHPLLRGVIHSFTSTISHAETYLDLGFYIGLNGIVTFARQYDEVIINTSLNRILLETDAPFLTPEPHRGKRNESSYILSIAQKIADLKNVSFDEVTAMTSTNTSQLFGFAID